MKKTLIIIDYVKSINFYLNQKLLVKYNILGKILKIEFKIILKKYYPIFIFLLKSSMMKRIISLNYNHKIELKYELNKDLDQYLKYNF
jgi:hypothetical protein